MAWLRVVVKAADGSNCPRLPQAAPLAAHARHPDNVPARRPDNLARVQRGRGRRAKAGRVRVIGRQTALRHASRGTLPRSLEFRRHGIFTVMAGEGRRSTTLPVAAGKVVDGVLRTP